MRLTKGCTSMWYHIKMNCINCDASLNTRQRKYCGNSCQHEYQYHNYISAWKRGKKDGNRGIKTKLLSKHIKRYMLEKNNEKCSKCDWSQRHKITGSVPLEVDHIDGNAENNLESNLQLLCPNCHALTPYFRNLNRGRGRKGRK
ncbi:MAG: hypothetical protein ACI9BF_000251 [Candidatus Paceibacteria bacterium]|jgi:hypothetical protein